MVSGSGWLVVDNTTFKDHTANPIDISSYSSITISNSKLLNNQGGIKTFATASGTMAIYGCSFQVEMIYLMAFILIYL